MSGQFAIESLVHLRRAKDHADRYYADPLVLDDLASIAGLSKFHFHRRFRTVYRVTPARYICERRIERAQDLLRCTNLTITEVCTGVGFSSLGSFSSRFAEIVGESPSAFQRRWAGGGPKVPGCWVFMTGLAERRNPADDPRVDDPWVDGNPVDGTPVGDGRVGDGRVGDGRVGDGRSEDSKLGEAESGQG